MTKQMQMSPADEAASKFMAHKGYPDIRPISVDKIEGEDCWYYLYELPEGQLELEVDFHDEDWHFTVFMES